MKTLTNTIKNKSLVYLLFLLAFTTILLSSCGGTTGSGTNNISTVGNPDFELPTGKTAFYTDATQTTPVIQAATSSQISALKYVTTSWNSGNPVYEIFNALREYTYPDDEGVLDMSNIYKLLFEAGNTYESALTEVTELDDLTPVQAPFDFGTETVSYNFVSDNYALAQDGDTIYALLTWIWDESPKMSYGVIEGSFDEVTGDIELNMVYLVDYEGDSDYCLRTYITGNTESHTFTLKASKYNTGTNAYAVSMIGKGVSQSTNEDDYFVMKIIDNENLSEYTDGRYYKFSASADETELMAYEANGYELDEIDDPNNYSEEIETLDFFALDGSDHAVTVSDFDNNELILDY